MRLLHTVRHFYYIKLRKQQECITPKETRIQALFKFGHGIKSLLHVQLSVELQDKFFHKQA